MPTTVGSAVQIEKAHRGALEVLREHGSPENAERLEFLERLGGHLASIKFPVHLASAQSVLIASLAQIVAEQDARITALEEAAKPAAPKKAAKK